MLDTLADAANPWLSWTYVQNNWEELVAAGKEHITFVTLGDYHDQWRRVDGAWKLCHRTKLNRGHVGSFDVFAP